MSEEKKTETPDENIEAPEVVAHSAEGEGEELPWCGIQVKS